MRLKLYEDAVRAKSRTKKAEEAEPDHQMRRLKQTPTLAQLYLQGQTCCQSQSKVGGSAESKGQKSFRY